MAGKPPPPIFSSKKRGTKSEADSSSAMRDVTASESASSLLVICFTEAESEPLPPGAMPFFTLSEIAESRAAFSSPSGKTPPRER